MNKINFYWHSICAVIVVYAIRLNQIRAERMGILVQGLLHSLSSMTFRQVLKLNRIYMQLLHFNLVLEFGALRPIKNSAFIERNIHVR